MIEQVVRRAISDLPPEMAQVLARMSPDELETLANRVVLQVRVKQWIARQFAGELRKVSSLMESAFRDAGVV